MQAAARHISAPSRDMAAARESPSPYWVLNSQLFRMSLAAIFSAHLYGHISEASALRAIAVEIRRCLI